MLDNKSSTSSLFQELNEKYKINEYIPAEVFKHKSYIDTNQNGDLKYKCEFPVANFKADQFKLKLNGTKLTIEAVNQTYSPNLKENEYFKREINVPEFVDKETLSCFLESYDNLRNILIIEASIKENSSLIDKRKNLRTEIKKENVKQDYSIGSGYLKYKFDLSDYEPKNISISVRNKTVLQINAFKKIYDSNLKPIIQEFNHEIKLPENIEFHNIKNCFDESDGMLRIEIPMCAGDNDSIFVPKNSTNTNEEDKYLELTFDLNDFKFDGIHVSKNSENKNILEVKAVRLVDSRSYVRKYVLPDWVRAENINVQQESQNAQNKVKNFLIVQLPILD